MVQIIMVSKKVPGHADETLTNRFLGLGGGRCNRGRTKACFVTENTAGDTLLHRDKDGADGTAGNGARVECGLHNRLDSLRNLGEVQKQQEHAGENVDNRHDRDNVGRNLGDAGKIGFVHLAEGNPEHGRELQAGYTVPRKTEAKDQKNENGKGEKP